MSGAIGAPLSDNQITKVWASMSKSLSCWRICPVDQSISSIESPHGPLLLFPLKSGLANGARVLPGIGCGK